MPPAQAWRTLRYSSTLKSLAPSLLSQKGKGWTTFTPPAAAPCRRFRGLVSHRRSQPPPPAASAGSHERGASESASLSAPEASRAEWLNDHREAIQTRIRGPALRTGAG